MGRHSKFTDEDVQKMREMIADGSTTTEVGRVFGASKSTVSSRIKAIAKKTKTTKVVRRPKMIEVPLIRNTQTGKTALIIGSPTDITAVLGDLWK